MKCKISLQTNQNIQKINGVKKVQDIHLRKKIFFKILNAFNTRALNHLGKLWISLNKIFTN